MSQKESMPAESSVPAILTARTLDAVADYLHNGKKKRVVVLTGAGISTAAGIPDFRSPETGLYNNLARLNLPHAEAVFDIEYFRHNPKPFYILAQELYPGKFSPTISHVFIALLARKGLLRALFTQNIDCLERVAGVPAEKIVEAHGSFATQRCIDCLEPYPDNEMRVHIAKGEVPRCLKRSCHGIVKPDIVFFGEPLPRVFAERAPEVMLADLVIIIGTSLSVYPFGGLPNQTRQGMPRVLLNMQQVGNLGSRADDVVHLGPCDTGIRRLVDALGWRDELEQSWRDLVGEEEAAAQNRRQSLDEDTLGEEVRRLTEGVESMLRLDDQSSEKESSSSEQGRGTEDERATRKVQEVYKLPQADLVGNNKGEAYQSPEHEIRPAPKKTTENLTFSSSDAVVIPVLNSKENSSSCNDESEDCSSKRMAQNHPPLIMDKPDD